MPLDDATIAAPVAQAHPMRPGAESTVVFPRRTADRFADVRRIAVVRGGGLGDLLFALPAVESLAAAYPQAEITVLGMPLHRELLAGRPGPVSKVELLPFAPGVRDAKPGRHAEKRADFCARMAAERFDLAVQLHGGGRNSNGFVLDLAARHTVGCATPDAPALERMMAHGYYQHEMLRWLEVAGLAGAPAVQLEPRLALGPRDLPSARRFLADAWPAVAGGPGGWPGPGGEPLVVIHPGATDPRRRWPADRFGQVAARLAADGCRVVVLGDGTEADLAREVTQEARRRCSEDPPGGTEGSADPGSIADAGGRLDVAGMCGLLSLASVVLANDSGPRHLAQALGTRTAGIYWAPNLVNAGPLGRAEHRVQLAWRMSCPVCGASAADETVPRCPHDCSFVADVQVDAVYQDVLNLLAPDRRG